MAEFNYLNFYDEVEVDLDHQKSVEEEQFPLWYQQLLKLDNSARARRQKEALEKIRISKPETFKFIMKFNCELIGFTPNTQYTLPKANSQDREVTWMHPYGIDTLLFWCQQFKFAFSVNANLMYNESKLAQIAGNVVPSLRGLTG